MARVLLGISVLSGVLVWLSVSPARDTVRAGAMLASPGLLSQQAPLPAAPIVRLGSAPEAPRWLSGTIIVDDTLGSPGIPYLAYLDDRGRKRTKQLIVVDQRGCRPDAGDLPCAPTSSASYPRLPAGAPVRVYGSIDADRFVASRIELSETLY